MIRRPAPLMMLAACLIGPAMGGCAPQVRPAVPPPLAADGWRATADRTAAADTATLGTLLAAPELDRLLDTALADSPRLRAATARIGQATGQLRVARSAGLPVVSATVQPGGSRLPGDRGLFDFDRSFASIDAAIDPDLSGRNRALARSAAARVAAARFDRAAAAIALEAEVALAYVQARTLRQRLALLDRSIVQVAEIDRIMRIRAREGEATRIDVGLQTIRLDQLRGERTRLIEAEQLTVNALAVLLGSEPAAFALGGGGAATLPTPAPLAVPPPARLIERRPDVRAAEARLAAAGGDIDAARRAFYPSLGLSGSVLATSAGLGPLVPLVRIGSDLLAPIFANSRLRGELALTVAQQEEAAAAYRQAVLEALRGVEDAMTSIRYARERGALLARVEQEARETSRLARIQYLEGEADLLQLLDAQDLLISAQDARALAAQELLAATIALYAGTRG